MCVLARTKLLKQKKNMSTVNLECLEIIVNNDVVVVEKPEKSSKKKSADHLRTRKRVYWYHRKSLLSFSCRSVKSCANWHFSLSLKSLLTQTDFFLLFFLVLIAAVTTSIELAAARTKRVYISFSFWHFFIIYAVYAIICCLVRIVFENCELCLHTMICRGWWISTIYRESRNNLSVSPDKSQCVNVPLDTHANRTCKIVHTCDLQHACCFAHKKDCIYIYIYPKNVCTVTEGSQYWRMVREHSIP